jgi:hypothetical protein
MGDERAQFKTIRLCSIKAALSNTIAVVVNRISCSARYGCGCSSLAAPKGAAVPLRVAMPSIEWESL